ncbi:hypothetical protein BDW75DRAFT_216004 [Aspergillus navahoensis]
MDEFQQPLESSCPYTKRPQNLAGFTCHTPPLGLRSTSSLGQRCLGTVYNIDKPTASSNLPTQPIISANLCRVNSKLVLIKSGTVRMGTTTSCA